MTKMLYSIQEKIVTKTDYITITFSVPIDTIDIRTFNI